MTGERGTRKQRQKQAPRAACAHNWQTYGQSYGTTSTPPTWSQWCPICGATQTVTIRTTSATTATVSIKHVQEAHDTYQ